MRSVRGRHAHAVAAGKDPEADGYEIGTHTRDDH
jgi:hypothetical protein